PLPLRQEDVRFQGHAIEVRLCAEDVGQGFMPQSGTMRLWKAPDALRVEQALRSGAEIPPYYDSMIAKVIAHGDTRDEARRHLVRGLEQMVALGVTTNQVFLGSCLEHPVFAEGGATTAFIEQHQDSLLAQDAAAIAVRQRGAALAAVLLFETAGGAPERPLLRRLAHSLPVGLLLEQGGERQAVQLTQTGTCHFAVAVDGREHRIELVALMEDSARVVIDGVMESAAFHRDGTELWLHYAGLPLAITDLTRGV